MLLHLRGKDEIIKLTNNIPDSVKRQDRKELEVSFVTLQRAYEELRHAYDMELMKKGRYEKIIY